MKVSGFSDEYLLSSSEDDFDEDTDKKKHNLFTKEDDEKLKDIVEKHYKNDLRKINWSFVAFQMSNKNKRQCKDRYINYLRDGINAGKFSPEENYLLLCKVEEIGHKWRMIAKFFTNRTDIMIKAQYRKLMRRHATKENVMYIDADTLRKSRNKRKHSHENKNHEKFENSSKKETIHYNVEINDINPFDAVSFDNCIFEAELDDFSIFEDFI